MTSRERRARMQARIDELLEDIRITEADLDAKRRRDDLHGIRDACVDIEIAKGKIQELKGWLDTYEL